MLLATILALGTVLICILLHYEVLTRTSRFIPAAGPVARLRFLLMMGVVIVTHIVEIWIFAGLLLLVRGYWGIGHIAGDFQGAFFDYVYFSAVTYTSLGLGDVWPHGPLRLITGLEALSGLLLIGWSVWFSYPIVRKGCQFANRDSS